MRSKSLPDTYRGVPRPFAAFPYSTSTSNHNQNTIPHQQDSVPLSMQGETLGGEVKPHYSAVAPLFYSAIMPFVYMTNAASIRRIW